MTRRIVWSALLALAVLILGGVWFAASFEQVAVERWTPPGKEARRNPYLALERFMTTMGRPLVRAASAAALDELPAGGVLILDSQRRAHLTPARLERLLAWVADGGYLIVAPEAPGVDDPILAFFEVDCGCASPKPEEAPAAAAKRPEPAKSFTVAVPGAARPLQIQAAVASLQAGEVEPDWRAGPPSAPDRLLHFRHGAGQVTIIAGLSWLFDNRRIGELDHAELLWTLVETYQPERARPLVLMARLATPTLWEWLAEAAWTAVLAAAALLALGLWAALPRFGPPRPEPEAARRELGEHLAAVGRYVWRAGGLEHWLDAARDSFRTRLAQRHPAILALPPAEQAAALAEITRRPAALIAAALHQPAASPQSFTLAVATLRDLESLL